LSWCIDSNIKSKAHELHGSTQEQRASFMPDTVVAQFICATSMQGVLPMVLPIAALSQTCPKLSQKLLQLGRGLVGTFNLATAVQLPQTLASMVNHCGYSAHMEDGAC